MFCSRYDTIHLFNIVPVVTPFTSTISFPSWHHSLPQYHYSLTSFTFSTSFPSTHRSRHDTIHFHNIITVITPLTSAISFPSRNHLLPQYHFQHSLPQYGSRNDIIYLHNIVLAMTLFTSQIIPTIYFHNIVPTVHFHNIVPTIHFHNIVPVMTSFPSTRRSHHSLPQCHSLPQYRLITFIQNRYK